MKKLNQLLKIPIIFVFLCFNLTTSAYAHFNEIREDITPYGKHIYYEKDRGKGIEYLGDSMSIEQVTQWYFYKGFTVGENLKDSVANRFFVSDEIHNKIYQFQDERSWKQFLNQNYLLPNYIRWHSSNWSMFPVNDNMNSDLLSAYIIGAIILATIVILLFITLLINVLAYFFYNTESPFNIFMFLLKMIWQILWKSTIFIAIPIFIISYLLGAFPQSI